MRKNESPIDWANRRAKSIKAERGQGWEAHYKELSQFIEPFRSRFYTKNAGQGVMSRTNDILAGKASRASRILSAGLMTGLTSPARPWFNMQTPDPEMMKFGPVKEWLDAVEQKIYAVFNVSNYYQVLPSVYRDIGVYGTAPSSIVFDKDDIIRCQSYSVGQYYIGQNHKQQVDTFYREYSATVSQIMSQFERSRVDAKVREAYDRGDYERRFEVCHLIEPNDDSIPLGMGSGRPFRGLYWLKASDRTKKGADAFLEAKGFFENPIFCPRWDLNADDTYGIGPSFDALPEVKQLQAMQRRKMSQITKAIDPPMRATSDLKNNRTSTLAGDVTYMGNERSVYEPLYMPQANITPLREEIERVERAIEEYFYVDTFLMIAHSDKSMTATEVAERQEEKLIQLGPTLTRMKDELLDPQIKLVYNILKRNNLLPPPPDEIVALGDSFEIEYISLLAQAQKAVSTTSIERTAALASSLGAEDSRARYRFNADAALQRYANDIGAPANVLRSDEEVDKMIQQDAERQQAVEGMEAAAQAGQTAQNLAQVDMTGENLFSAMAGL